MIKKTGIPILSMLMSLLLISTGCHQYFMQQPSQPTQARLGEVSQGNIDLKNLPAPKDQVVVAVYKFRDQTGQYKPSETGANWSTAVTQGATTILIKALEDSGWFAPIERENVSNLLNERKIIRSSRKQYNQNETQLPALLYAGVIIEGGIISYDANVITGGSGLRYFGLGGSNQYRQDRVTVYLRAVSTSNGKILKTVYTSKTILSQALDGGLFRFVRFGRLLEAEMGFTYNEPTEMAVTEAIEKAVLSLIVEGIEDELWKLKEERQIIHPLIKEYQEERNEIPRTDLFGKKLDNQRRKLGIGINAATTVYQGDYPQGGTNLGGNLKLQYNMTPQWGLYLSGGRNKLTAGDFYSADLTFGDLGIDFRMLPFGVISPYISGGIGVGMAPSTTVLGAGNELFPKIQYQIGLEYMMSKSTGINLSIGQDYSLTDRVDAVEQGRLNDYYWNGQVGLRFYFGNQVKAKREFKYNPDPYRE